MSSEPRISICIPAYGRAHLLRKLLDSIVIQSYTDFDLVITDNSAGDEVERLCEAYKGRLDLNYHRNEQFLEMGGNWNACMKRGKGQWLKMMHDDDWFVDTDSLRQFAEQAGKMQRGFIYAGFYNVDEDSEERTLFLRTPMDIFLMKQSPFNILRGNYIGAPSVTMIHRDTFQAFNPNLKWVVDTDGFLRMFQRKHGIAYIKEPLLSILQHRGQATTKFFRNAVVEIYENCVMLAPHYPAFCRNIFAYDHTWRLLRNLEIGDKAQLLGLAREATVPPVMFSMVRFQRSIPKAFLKKKLLSKGFMFLHYLCFNLSLLFSKKV